MKRVVIIGAGLSGLVTGYRLTQLGAHDVQIYERATRVGGRVASETLPGGFVADHADFLVGNYRNALRLVRELGLQRELREIDSRNFFCLYREGRIHPLEPDLWSFLTTNVLRSREKLDLMRFFAGALARQRRGGFLDPSRLARYEHTRLSDFLQRRFAPSTLDILLNPMAGMTGASPEDLSVASMLSLFSTVLAKHHAFVRGSEIFPKHIAEAGPIVKLGTAVERIVIEGSRARAVVLDGGETVEAEVVVCATPAPTAASLLRDLGPEATACLRDTRYSERLDVLLALDRPCLPSWALVIPNSAGSFISYLIEETFKSDQRAPAGRGLAKAMICGENARRLAGASDNEIVAQVLSELERLLPDFPDDLLESRVLRHRQVVPISGPGYQPALARFNDRISRFENLMTIGDFQSNGTIEAAVHQGERAAARITG